MAKKVFTSKIGEQLSSKIARPFITREQIILRDYLALQRTTLANERTLFSYIRTSLYLVLGGIGLSQVEQLAHLKSVGTVALVLSALILIYGITRYLVLRIKLKKFYNIIHLNDEELERINQRNEEGSQNPKNDV